MATDQSTPDPEGSMPSMRALVSATRTHARGPANTSSYGVLDRLAEEGRQLSYRKLDHWCRHGVIQIACDADGSGSSRQFTEAEYLALRDLVDEETELDRRYRLIRDGSLFAERLAHWASNHG